MPIHIQTLVKRADFQQIKAHGQRVSTQGFVVQYMPWPTPGLALGFTCSRALGGAVARNRARRRLKAAVDRAVRLNPSAQMGPQGVACVVVGKMPIFDIKFKHLIKDIQLAFTQVGVECPLSITT